MAPGAAEASARGGCISIPGNDNAPAQTNGSKGLDTAMAAIASMLWVTVTVGSESLQEQTHFQRFHDWMRPGSAKSTPFVQKER